MYNLKKERFTIMNVNEVTKEEVVELLNKLREKYFDYPVFNRTNKSFINEFLVHKFLYKIGILRSKTKDAGMQYPISSFLEFLYSVFGAIFGLFVK